MLLRAGGLPGAWAGRTHWSLLDTRFGAGLDFLRVWQAWQADTARPRLLHYVAVANAAPPPDDLLQAARQHPDLLPLATLVADQAVGLTPGFHRLGFDQGRVLLTLCIGDTDAMLRELAFRADTVCLQGDEAAPPPALSGPGLVKAIARLCRRGTVLVSRHPGTVARDDLQACGFVLEPATDDAPWPAGRLGCYAPPWEVKGLHPTPERTPQHCVVIGAGLAGAAAASSLARRGWTVEVLDAGDNVATGASALPAGLMAPHQSPDDNPLSRLSRAGIRQTWQAAESLLRAGLDWAPCGALERRGDDRRPPPALGPALALWSRAATLEEHATGGMAATGSSWWHTRAAWVKPGALVRAWLGASGITVRTGQPVHALERTADGWRALDAAGHGLAEAPLLVVAAAHGSAHLLAGRLTLHPVRGQVSWALHPQPPVDWPRCAVNGHGHFLPRVPLAAGDAWLAGATYGRRDTDTAPRDADQAANLDRLRDLVPAMAAALAPQFRAGTVQAWTGVRCASQDRKPLVGELEHGLWVSTALGSRGLTFAALLGELLAARLHGEPLPLEARLAAALDAGRPTGP